MALPLYAVPAIAQGVSAIAGYGSARKARKQKRRAQNQYLTTLGGFAREGDIPVSAQSRIMGAVGRDTGAATQRTVADASGRLLSQGMGGSVAGVRALNEPGIQRMRTLGDVRSDLSTRNELSKQGYKRQMADARLGFSMDSAGEGDAIRGNLMGGLAGAGMSLASGFQDEKLFQDYDTWNKGMGQAQLLLSSGNYDEAMEILRQIYGGVTPKPKYRAAPARSMGDYNRPVTGGRMG